MEFDTVSQILASAVNQVIERDNHLLVHDLHERAISHRLAVYFEPHFPEFNVDCEYNGNVDADNGRKYVVILRQTAINLRIKLRGDEVDDDMIERSVYPDIIVHKRGGNGPKNNLLVVEMKLTSSQITEAWDTTKLSLFTSGGNENRYSYQYGVFVRFGVKDQTGFHEVHWYRNGQRFQ